MFSVVIPAYNAEKFVSTAIESVLRQSYTDFEIIVVDDGSRDNTAAVVAGMPDARIRYIYQENAGVSAARNTGIRQSSGEFICFLDADDLWLENHLEVLDRLIRAYPESWTYITGHRICLTNGEILSRTEKLLKAVDQQDFSSDNAYGLILRYGYFLHTNSMCCRRAAFDKVGWFEPGVRNGEDDDMWYRLFAYFPVAVSKEVTTQYNRENSGATAKFSVAVDWIFLNRVGEIMASPEVTPQRKESLHRILERKKLSRIRLEIVEGNKGTALRKLLKLDASLLPGKKYLTTWVSLLVPHKWIRKRLEARDRAFYR